MAAPKRPNRAFVDNRFPPKPKPEPKKRRETHADYRARGYALRGTPFARDLEERVARRCKANGRSST